MFIKSLLWFVGAFFLLLLGRGQIFFFHEGIFEVVMDIGLFVYGAPFYLGGDGFLINIFGMGYCGFYTKGSGFLCWIAFILFIVGVVEVIRAIVRATAKE